MRFARCECKKCDQEFVITFSNDILKHSLVCPICGCKDNKQIKITWIDRAGINMNNDKDIKSEGNHCPFLNKDCIKKQCKLWINGTTQTCCFVSLLYEISPGFV